MSEKEGFIWPVNNLKVYHQWQDNCGNTFTCNTVIMLCKDNPTRLAEGRGIWGTGYFLYQADTPKCRRDDLEWCLREMAMRCNSADLSRPCPECSRLIQEGMVRVARPSDVTPASERIYGQYPW